MGHRLRPGAAIRYTTDEFSTDLAINSEGVRDDVDIGPKAANERRVLVLGDSLVMAVQVPLAQTFGKRLEAKLNAADPAHRWRVINGGVQGYGPVEDWLFYKYVGAQFDADLVLVVVFDGNDITEADDSRAMLDEKRPDLSVAAGHVTDRTRSVLRSSMVWQLARVRYDMLRARLSGPTPERPLLAYLDHPPPDVFTGLDVAKRAFGLLADRAEASGARVAFVLMPARFQIDDGDFQRLSATVAETGGHMVRDAAGERLEAALAPLARPILDLQPILFAQPQRGDLFFVQNVHLTDRGHQVVADTLFSFLESRQLVAAGRP